MTLNASPIPLFPAFEARRIATDDGVQIHANVGGEGPPLLLLHGHPQTHALWHRVAPALAGRFSVVACDLRGYGDSSKPAGAPDHANYSKRVMARDVLRVMQALGHARFAVMAHDRGARVAHRLAADHPEAVSRLVLLDIAPTLAMYEQTGEAFALRDVMGRRSAGLPPFDARAGRVRALPVAARRRARAVRGLPGGGGHRPGARPRRSCRAAPPAHAAAGAVGGAGRGAALLPPARRVAPRGGGRARRGAALRPLHRRGGA